MEGVLKCSKPFHCLDPPAICCRECKTTLDDPHQFCTVCTIISNSVTVEGNPGRSASKMTLAVMKATMYCVCTVVSTVTVVALSDNLPRATHAHSRTPKQQSRQIAITANCRCLCCMSLISR